MGTKSFKARTNGYMCCMLVYKSEFVDAVVSTVVMEDCLVFLPTRPMIPSHFAEKMKSFAYPSV